MGNCECCKNRIKNQFGEQVCELWQEVVLLPENYIDNCEEFKGETKEKSD